MVKGKSIFAAAALAAASLSTSQAVVFNEPASDAGQTLATAAAAGAVPNLTAINGSIGTGSDADLYSFTVSTSGPYRFTTVSAAVDTALFLFSGTGAALLTNDDATGLTLTSSLSASLVAGATYYLGISISGNEPVNSASQLLFVGYPAGDTTAVRGPASGVNPTTLASFNSFNQDQTTGTYSINIAPVPEPSTWAMVGLTGIAAAAYLRRRQQAA